MLQILKKNSFITDTLFSDICSENFLENEIKKFDNIAKDLFDNYSESNGSNIKLKFIELNKIAEDIFGKLSGNNSLDRNFILYIDELKQLYKLELKQYEEFFLKRSNQKIEVSGNVLYEKKFFFNQIKLDTLNKILNISNKYKKIFEINISKKLNSRKDLSINTGKDIRKIIKILNNEFDQNGVNNIVSNYVRKKFEVIGCAIELSTPDSTWWKESGNKKISSQTIYAHIDQSLTCPKSICYLSDVEIENGPTSFYPDIYDNLKLNFFQNIFGRINLNVGQNKNSKLYKIYNKDSNRLYDSPERLKHLSKIPKNIFFDSHLGWYIKKDSQLEKIFLQKEKFMLGKAGLFVVFDGSKLFHRGGCIKKDTRLVLQITFGERLNIMKKIIEKIYNIIS
jgi:transcriptional regulator